MPNLLINIDHVATLRNARREAFPDPVEAARLCEASGADGIVFHLREDRRHINDQDVVRLKQAVRGKLDFELSTNEEIVEICCRTRPDLATLVPERREEITTEGGLDVIRRQAALTVTVDRLKKAGIGEVALFVDPDVDQIRVVRDTGASTIELHTGDFANAPAGADQLHEANRIAKAAEFAHECGLIVHAGHGLDYENYHLFSRSVPHVREVSIGFSVIARSIFTGLGAAVTEMARLVKGQDAS
ncbi:MAG: pyridoxine 5'-phosphate synthase [Rhodothermaceae bacterium]|nr:pyridoxine 5'-phosphate synthase [Rhodothermaceae bacterium]MYG68821.1 pyridoxine 5'-phosphate synthase [Rhodothermaceae bacterium]MYJ43995.1 pyridoxine 5'-phosphate synthase [Rhodothermaceae bacterium]